MYLLIDGDIILYNAGFSIEHTIYELHMDGRVYSTEKAKDYKDYIKRNGLEEHQYELIRKRRTDPIESAYFAADRVLKDIGVKKNNYIILFTGKGNFRESVEPRYKSNRNDADKPIFLEDIRSYLQKKYNTATVPWCEADDMLGILQWEDYKKNNGQIDKCSTCIVTIDKDLDMIPGHHYNLWTGEPYWVDEDSASYCFWHQMLTGDTADNIKGCPGIGKKKAQDILEPYLDDVDSMEEAVINTFYSTHETQLDAEQSFDIDSMLLWIAREVDDLPISEEKREEVRLVKETCTPN